MDILEAVQKRHTIRTYDGRAIEGEVLDELQAMIADFNEAGRIHMQLVNGREGAFDEFTIRYGKWTNVTNYIAMVGADADDLDERLGYYGEKIVLWAQTVGLKTGWVETQLKAPTDAFELAPGERHVLSLAIGYSELEGRAHKIKGADQLSRVEGEAPEWFARGVDCAVLAPTAGNQQLFTIAYEDGRVSISTVPGFLEQVDLGIAKYHFELGSGRDSSIWS